MLKTISGLAIGMLAGAAVAASDALHDMTPYPPPAQGMQRLVFRVPTVADETDRRVEVVVGRTTSVDCNRARYMGSLERRTAAGEAR